jgi:hypothetical protein
MAGKAEKQRYSVVEIDTGDIIYDNETDEVLAARFSMQPQSFTVYAYTGKPFKGKYNVIINPNRNWIEQFKIEWTRITNELLTKNAAGARFYY